MTSPRTTRSLIRLAAAGSAALLLAGCGSSGDSGDADESSTSTSSATSSTSASTTSQAPSESSSTSTSSAAQEPTVTLDAPDSGQHKPTIHKGQGDAVIAIRHHPAGAPVRAVIVNKGAQDFDVEVTTGTGSDATTLHTLTNGTQQPLKLTADAKTIRVTSSGHWLVKLLPDD